MEPEHDVRTPLLQIRLFGPLEVCLEGVPIPPLRPRKLQWLIALLLLRHPRPLERTWLAATLWPDSDPEHALFSLRQSLLSLRRALGTAAHHLISPSARTLALDLQDVWIDLLEFDFAAAQSDPTCLESATALYRGPLLEGCHEEWVLPERQRREHQFLNALEQLAEAALQAGQSEAAVSYLRRVIEIEPLRESVHRRLMQAYAQSGEVAAATQVYRQLRLRLHEQLQSQPDAQTLALYEELQREARERATASAPARGEVGSPSPAPTRTNLPVALSSFIGRTQEIARIEAMLHLPALPSRSAGFVEARPERVGRMSLGAGASALRLLTLTGAGGCGKTRLAIEVASRLLQDYSAGVWMVELAALTDEALVPQRVARALGVPEQTGKTPTQTLIAHLKTRRLLLVLDNCEHLVSSCAELTTTLLQQCPDLKVLATSRSPLNVEGEIVWRVPSLPVPDPSLLLANKDLGGLILEYDACRLFVERAHRHRPDLQLSGTSIVSIARICARLDGIPLAIELAAARVRSLSVEQIEARLDPRLQVLRGGSRSTLPRHQTLRALIEWSWNLLDRAERLLLSRLSVFAGGWTLEAAEAVCAGEGVGYRVSGVEEMPALRPAAHPADGDGMSSTRPPTPHTPHPEEVLDRLTSLVDKSLVMYEEREDTGRYRLLETVRQFAREKLQECGEEAELFTRHGEYFLTLAEEARQNLSGPEQAVWLDRLQVEYDNLRVALSRCCGTEAERGLRLAGALWRFWMIRGYLSEGLTRLMEALERPEASEATPARARALSGAASLISSQGDHDRARMLLTESLTIQRRIGNRQGIASALGNLGDTARQQGDYAVARAYLEESLTVSRELGDRHGIAVSLLNLGAVAQCQGDNGSAWAYNEESLAIFRDCGHRQGIAATLGNLGSAADDRGDHMSARTFQEESLAIFREIGDRQGIARTLHNLGNTVAHLGDYALARTYHEQGLAIRREIGARQGVALSLYNLGNVVSLLGDKAASQVHYTESLAICRDIGDQRGISDSLSGLATLAAADGSHERGALLWGAAEALREEIGSPLPPNSRESYDGAVSEARQELGTEAFMVAWAQGRAMSLEQAVATALEEIR